MRNQGNTQANDLKNQNNKANTWESKATVILQPIEHSLTITDYSATVRENNCLATGISFDLLTQVFNTSKRSMNSVF